MTMNYRYIILENSAYEGFSLPLGVFSNIKTATKVFNSLAQHEESNIKKEKISLGIYDLKKHQFRLKKGYMEGWEE